MTRRRRVDLSVILGEDVPPPRIRNEAVPGGFLTLLSTFEEILALDDPDAVLRRAVELARTRIGLARAGIFLLDRPRNLMLGTWGSDMRGAIVDEHQIMYAVGETERAAFRRAQEEGAPFTVFEGCPLVEHHGAETSIVGCGWVAYTPIRSGEGPIGMLFNDGGATSAPVDPAKQAHAAILCSLLGSLLDPVRSTRGLPPVRPKESSERGLAAAAATILAKDPSLPVGEVAERLAVSHPRLARAFKAEMGLSLVAYRNRLRLDRFTALLDTGRRNLLEAALEAGFGSYAQFHRVFRALRHEAPREHLRRRL